MARALGSARVNDWAGYRLQSGVYFYRCFNPKVAGREGKLQLAMSEFNAVLKLQPGNDDAQKFQNQILHNQNILGLPRDLDLTPDFDTYIHEYTTWVGVVSNAFNSGIAALFVKDAKHDNAKVMGVFKDEIAGRLTIDQLQVKIAHDGMDAADIGVTDTTNRVNDLANQIRAAKAEMDNQSISIGDVIGTVAEVGAAVLAVAAAIPSAGTSLIALVPDIYMLVNTVDQTFSPIGKQLYDLSSDDIAKLKKSYGQVSSDAAAVQKAIKAGVSLVGAVQKLANGSTPDNSRVLALVRQAAELAQQLQLAYIHKDQADLTYLASTIQQANDQALLNSANKLIGELEKDQDVLQRAGLTAIKIAQSYIDWLLTNLFKAERALEIYTLREAGDEAGSVLFDSGYVSPDVEQDFIEQDITLVELISAYQQSWLNFLAPINMETRYVAYFDGKSLIGDVQYLSFKDPAMIENFKRTQTLRFNVELLSDFLPQEFEAKIEVGLNVALLGATSRSPFVRTHLRHGAIYPSKMRSKVNLAALLEPKWTQILAPMIAFQTSGITPITGVATTSINFVAQPLWGRGVAGEWELTVAPGEMQLDAVNLEGLTEIQVWIPYQAFS